MRTSIMAKATLIALCLTILTAVPICGQQSDAPEAYFVFKNDPAPDTFVIKLTDPQKIQQARDILATGTRKIVAGTIIKQPWLPSIFLVRSHARVCFCLDSIFKQVRTIFRRSLHKQKTLNKNSMHYLLTLSGAFPIFPG